MFKTERSKRGIGVIDTAVSPTLRSVAPTQIPLAKILNVCTCKNPEIEVDKSNIAVCQKCGGVC